MIPADRPQTPGPFGCNPALTQTPIMKTAILVLYIVTGGHMSTVRIPQESLERCESIRAKYATELNAMHAECKVKKVKS